MNAEKDVLEKEITGDTVRARLGDKDYPLAFPNHNVALYSQETAKLNCRRAKAAKESGRPELSSKELRSMRVTLQRLHDERYELQERFRATREEDRPSKAELFAEISATAEEMISIDIRLSEEVGTGDSLFKLINWWKIRDDDPERVLLALWCGLHVEVSEGKWAAPFTVKQLDKLVDFSNVVYLLTQITLALAQHMPKVEDSKLPKGEGPAPAAPAAGEMTTVQ